MKNTAFDIRALIRPDLLDLPPYVPVEPTDVLAERLGVTCDDVIKLDANENPYGPSPKALAAIAAERGYHIYPDPEQRRVRDALGAHLAVDADSVVCGLGSDDLIDLILRAVVSPGDVVIDCPPTFGMYRFSAEVAGGTVVQIPRQETFALDGDRIERDGIAAKAIFVASPNNPTGNRISEDELSRLLATAWLVVVDEAYIEFAGEDRSVVPLVADHENLVVLRTFSKWAGLAGIRAGYGVMSPVLASLLMAIKQPYNLNVAAAAAVLASLADRALLMERVRRIIEERERLFAMLGDLSWVRPYPSEANFILCRLDGVGALEAKGRLAARGIFVRHFDTPMLRNHLRISVGLPEHSERVVRALREIGAELGR